ncbi:helix-turn-helix domain-containing protein [Streptomyces boncukensis]|uniref:Helix-turn-helix domain-containing protein n=1 Tax=Streptomyces boncukensis TaxID=2711219 RepID=A0A6G4WVM2_9ACTN|nr:helix-turn-helix transcriptional regulator [Streptomyces boncukensis]NGO69053.1 helix-turn-helix domain-containing protein [Streptomyces boncukensis]
MTLDPSQAGRDRHTLATALRDLRRASGLSGERLAARCGMSQSKVSRIENGKTLPTAVDVQQMLAALGVDAETTDELRQLALTANAEYEDVRASVRRGLHHRQRELAALEADATRVGYFLPAIPTGLLQTPEYMRQAMSPPVDPVEGDISRTIALKLERQAVLHEPHVRLDFLLTESAVRWQLCEPQTMALQIDRMISLSQLPAVSVSVIPLTAHIPQVPYHTFTVYDQHLVTIELFTGRVVLRDPRDVQHYTRLFEFFAENAREGDDARSLLQGWADDFRTTRP